MTADEDTRTLTVSLRSLLHRLKVEHHGLEDRLKSVQKRISKDIAAAKEEAEDDTEQRYMPRTAILSWFAEQGIATPCTVEQFFEVLFQKIVEEHRADPIRRTLLLNEEEADLFRLHPRTLYKWSEVIQRITNVFHLEV